MSYVPKPLRDSYDYGDLPVAGTHRVTSITVYALRENPRPVGFAPWPKARKRKRKS
jgi:hypothetical protein